jgi:hypothetical protein
MTMPDNDVAKMPSVLGQPQPAVLPRFRFRGVRELGIFAALMLICIGLSIASPYFLVA